MMRIRIGNWYRNIKTKDVYVVLSIGLAAWDSRQCLIVYQRMGGNDKTVWIRSRTEFNEKFEEVSSNNEI
jgi:hypothetical protein